MNYLLDTHLLLWAAGQPERLSSIARALIEDRNNQLHYSPASLWEISIKRNLGRKDFQAEPRLLKRGMLDNGYVELPITSEHALALDLLPPIHKDPFDRILLAQAFAEGITLVTVDPVLLQYPVSVRGV